MNNLDETRPFNVLSSSNKLFSFIDIHCYTLLYIAIHCYTLLYSVPVRWMKPRDVLAY